MVRATGLLIDAELSGHILELQCARAHFALLHDTRPNRIEPTRSGQIVILSTSFGGGLVDHRRSLRFLCLLGTGTRRLCPLQAVDL